MATGYVLDGWGSRVRSPAGGWEFFTSPPCPERLWGLPFNCTGDSFSGGKWLGIKLTIHLHLVPRPRMCGAMPPLTQYIFMAWCLVKHRDNFIFTLYYWSRGNSVNIVCRLRSVRTRFCSRKCQAFLLSSYLDQNWGPLILLAHA
jgi:hypothetical protein